jgi:hypothetical protein
MSWLNPISWFSKTKTTNTELSNTTNNTTTDNIVQSVLQLDHDLALKNATDLLQVAFGKNYDMLLSVLNATGAVISGSFPLQCYLNEVWAESDIDIFCPVEKSVITDHAIHIIFTQIFKANGIPLSDAQKATSYRLSVPESESIMNLKPVDIKTRYGNITEIFQVMDYTLPNNKKVQVIYYDGANKLSATPYEYVCKHFDFDFVKNAFGVTNNISWIKNNDDNSVLNRMSIYRISPTASVENSNKRKIKYTARGFKFFCDGKEINNSETSDIKKDISDFTCLE